MKLKIPNNRVLVKPDEEIKKTDFGLLLAKENIEKPTTGLVIIGNKEVKKGTKILFSKFGYDEVVLEKEVYYIVSSPNILGIYE